jgi:hypothetical protein
MSQDEMIAVYNTAGALVSWATQANSDTNPNGNSFHLPPGTANQSDRGTWFDRDQDVAFGGGRIVRNGLVFDNNLAGLTRRIVMPWAVGPGGIPLTPMDGILPDDDFNGGAGPSIDPGSSNDYRTAAAVDVDDNGNFLVAWRTAENAAVVARVYDADGNALTDSFYVSSLPDPTLDNSGNIGARNQDNTMLDVAISGETICVVWTSDNAVSGLDAADCNGFNKSPTYGQVARLFVVNALLAPTAGVRNWDLY